MLSFKLLFFQIIMQTLKSKWFTLKFDCNNSLLKAVVDTSRYILVEKTFIKKTWHTNDGTSQQYQFSFVGTKHSICQIQGIKFVHCHNVKYCSRKTNDCIKIRVVTNVCNKTEERVRQKLQYQQSAYCLLASLFPMHEEVKYKIIINGITK